MKDCFTVQAFRGVQANTESEKTGCFLFPAWNGAWIRVVDRKQIASSFIPQRSISERNQAKQSINN
jgi:hypothetical protein